MVKQVSIGCMMIAVTGLIVWAGSARADPPPQGWMGSFSSPMIVCKESQSLKDLIAAQRKSRDEQNPDIYQAAVVDVMTGDKPKCQMAYVMNMVVGESEDVGEVTWGDQTEHLRIAHIGDSKSDAFALYEELVLKHDTSI